MKVLAIVSGKGGTGKTTTAFQLAHLSSRKGRTLAIDLDSQSSLTACFGVSPSADVADLLTGKKSISATTQELTPTLSLIASGIELAAAELTLASRPVARERALKRALIAALNSYDVIVIDTPPALGLLTANALTAADVALVVTLPEAMALHTLQNTLDSVELVRSEVNPGLQLAGILVCQFAGHLNHHTEAIEAMKAAKMPLLRTQIPRSIRAADMAALQEPITGPIGEAYEAAFKEIERWLRK